MYINPDLKKLVNSFWKYYFYIFEFNIKICGLNEYFVVRSVLKEAYGAFYTIFLKEHKFNGEID